jgi:hypothetical protein
MSAATTVLAGTLAVFFTGLGNARYRVSRSRGRAWALGKGRPQ